MQNQLEIITKEKSIEVENWKQKYEELFASKQAYISRTDFKVPDVEKEVEESIHHSELESDIDDILSRTGSEKLSTKQSKIQSNSEVFEKSISSSLSSFKNQSSKRLELKRSQSLVIPTNTEELMRNRSRSLTNLMNTNIFADASRSTSSIVSSSHPVVTQSTKPQNKKYVMNIKMKEFNSMPFRLGFFERLEYFAKEHRKIHEEHREKYQTMAKNINHKKLEPLFLVLPDSTSSNQFKVKKPLPAEFMPAPGNVPEPNKIKNAFILEKDARNLWGGRYKVQQKAKRLNVLNLFDISFEIKEEQVESEEDDK
jgi:hypothetical protein